MSRAPIRWDGLFHDYSSKPVIRHFVECHESEKNSALAYRKSPLAISRCLGSTPHPKPLYFRIIQPELSSERLNDLEEGGAGFAKRRLMVFVRLSAPALRTDHGSETRDATCKAENCSTAESTQYSENCWRGWIASRQRADGENQIVWRAPVTSTRRALTTPVRESRERRLLANCEEFRLAEPISKVSDLPDVTEKLAWQRSFLKSPPSRSMEPDRETVP